MPKLPPFASLHLARAHMEHTYPDHTNAVRHKSATIQSLLERLTELKEQRRRLALEQAAVEAEIKQQIGSFSGIEVEGGVLYWTKQRRNGKTRTDWMKLCRDYKIGENTLKRYRKEEEHRHLFYRAKQHASLPTDQVPTASEIDFDEDP